MGALAQDVRYAARFLFRNKTFAAVAIGTLALGIGATTGIFSILDAALLREPGVRDPGSLVAAYTTCRLGNPRCSSSYPDYLDYRDRTESLADLAAENPTQVVLESADGRVRQVAGTAVTGNYFPLLGVEPALGRLLQPQDDVPAATAVAVVSHDFWQSELGGDPGVVGRTLREFSGPIEIVGVVPETFQGLSLGEETDVWISLRSLPGVPEGFWSTRGIRLIARLVGRIAPGRTIDQAREELFAVSEALREEDPAARGPRSVTMDPLGRYLVPVGAEASLPQFVWFLMGVVGVTLLLAGTNLANLLLVRASARTNEIGVRMAIGLGRARLVRQLLTESALVSVLGGAAGLLVALGLIRFLSRYELPGGLAIAALEAGLDGRVLAIAAGSSVVAAVACGLVPALQSTRSNVIGGVQRGGGSELRRGSGRLRRSLVAVQVALCFVLLSGSALFLQSLRNALGSDLGFAPRNIATAKVSIGTLALDPAQRGAFALELRDRLLARPDARSVAVASRLPFAGGAGFGTFTSVDGYQPAPDEEMRIDLVFTTPGYFETLGIPLLAGRDFVDLDIEGGIPAAIINRTMADRYWPDGDAVGGILRSIALPGSEATRIQVVGVVEDVHWRAIDEEATNFVYRPIAQDASRVQLVTLAIRTSGIPIVFLPTLRGEIEAMNSGLPAINVSTMDEEIGQVLMPQRMGTVLFSGFGLLAVILAVVGVVGVVSYAVREQRRAIGVRLALGAGREGIVVRVVLGMALPVAIGLAAGLASTLIIDDAVGRFLYGIAPGDPPTYAVIACILVGVSAVAALLPAREAARVDPLTVLRAE